MELHIFEPSVFDLLPATERTKYTNLRKSLAISSGRPFFIGRDGLPDRDLDGFCTYLLEPRRGSPNTWKNYANQIAVFLRFLAAQGKTWKEVTRNDLISYHKVRTTGEFQVGKVIKGQSWNLAATAIVHLYEYAVESGLITTLPFKYQESRSWLGRGITKKSELLVKGNPEPINFISIRNYKNLWRPALAEKRNAQRNLALTDLLVTAGLRISEALSLQIHHLPNPDSPAYANRKSVSIRVVGKGNKARRVLVPKRILRALNFYITEERELTRLTCSNLGRLKISNNIFLTKNGSPLSPRSVQFFFEKISTELSIKLTPHGCRHTYAVYQLEAMIKRMALNLKELKKCGVDAYHQVLNDPLHQLQLLMGHSSQSSTYIYLDFLEESEALVDESLNDWSNWEHQNG